MRRQENGTFREKQEQFVSVAEKAYGRVVFHVRNDGANAETAFRQVCEKMHLSHHNREALERLVVSNTKHLHEIRGQRVSHRELTPVKKPPFGARTRALFRRIFRFRRK